MDIPFNNFKAVYKDRKSELITAFNSVFDSGTYILGKNVTSFEKAFADFLHLSYFAGVGNGTDAITIAAKAIGIKQGDEVIIPAITAYATVIGIENAGAIPVIVDIDYDTGLIDPNDIERKITKKTRAIVPVHLYGQICDMSTIMRLAAHYHLGVIEDCAHAVGATQHGISAGNFGDVAAFSFYPTKNLGAFGDAGGIATRKKTLFTHMKYMRNYGQVNRYKHMSWGINSRLDELQAALLLVNLTYVKQDIMKRIKIAHYYNKHITAVEPLKIHNGNVHSYHLYVVKTKKRSSFIQYLHSHRIETIIHYPIPCHLQKAFRYKKTRLPHAEKLSKEIVSIPLHPQLRRNEIEYIVDCVNSFR